MRNRKKIIPEIFSSDFGNSGTELPPIAKSETDNIIKVF